MITQRKHRAREWIILAILFLLVILLLSRSSGNVAGGGVDRAPWPVPAPLVAEHRELHAQLATATEAGGETGEAAQREDKPEIVEFAENLMLHAQTEEQVTYPAAILVGEYCEARGWR